MDPNVKRYAEHALRHARDAVTALEQEPTIITLATAIGALSAAKQAAIDAMTRILPGRANAPEAEQIAKESQEEE